MKTYYLILEDWDCWMQVPWQFVNPVFKENKIKLNKKI